jgi:hypothetical protein
MSKNFGKNITNERLLQTLVDAHKEYDKGFESMDNLAKSIELLASVNTNSSSSGGNSEVDDVKKSMDKFLASNTKVSNQINALIKSNEKQTNLMTKLDQTVKSVGFDVKDISENISKLTNSSSTQQATAYNNMKALIDDNKTSLNMVGSIIDGNNKKVMDVLGKQQKKAVNEIKGKSGAEISSEIRTGKMDTIAAKERDAYSDRHDEMVELEKEQIELLKQLLKDGVNGRGGSGNNGSNDDDSGFPWMKALLVGAPIAGMASVLSFLGQNKKYAGDMFKSVKKGMADAKTARTLKTGKPTKPIDPTKSKNLAKLGTQAEKASKASRIDKIRKATASKVDDAIKYTKGVGAKIATKSPALAKVAKVGFGAGKVLGKAVAHPLADVAIGAAQGAMNAEEMAERYGMTKSQSVMTGAAFGDVSNKGSQLYQTFDNLMGFYEGGKAAAVASGGNPYAILGGAITKGYGKMALRHSEDVKWAKDQIMGDGEKIQGYDVGDIRSRSFKELVYGDKGDNGVLNDEWGKNSLNMSKLQKLSHDEISTLISNADEMNLTDTDTKLLQSELRLKHNRKKRFIADQLKSGDSANKVEATQAYNMKYNSEAVKTEMARRAEEQEKLQQEAEEKKARAMEEDQLTNNQTDILQEISGYLKIMAGVPANGQPTIITPANKGQRDARS